MKSKELTFKKWLVTCSKEHKISLMNHAIKTDNISAYFALTKLFLSIPISEGGVASEDIPQPYEILTK